MGVYTSTFTTVFTLERRGLKDLINLEIESDVNFVGLSVLEVKRSLKSGSNKTVVVLQWKDLSGLDQNPFWSKTAAIFSLFERVNSNWSSPEEVDRLLSGAGHCHFAKPSAPVRRTDSRIISSDESGQPQIIRAPGFNPLPLSVLSDTGFFDFKPSKSSAFVAYNRSDFE